MSSRGGFSLIEALVVLAVGGMALAIIFSIGTKAGDTGFTLGRKALAAADSDIATSDYRAIIRSFELRPPGTSLKGVDLPFLASADKIIGSAVAERATACAPQGWAGTLTLTIEVSGANTVLKCAIPGKTTQLLSLPGRGKFSFSTDGAVWNPSFSNDPSAYRDPNGVQRVRLNVRFSVPNRIDLIEAIDSGRLNQWIRPDDQF